MLWVIILKNPPPWPKSLAGLGKNRCIFTIQFWHGMFYAIFPNLSYLRDRCVWLWDVNWRRSRFCIFFSRLYKDTALLFWVPRRCWQLVWAFRVLFSSHRHFPPDFCPTDRWSSGRSFRLSRKALLPPRLIASTSLIWFRKEYYELGDWTIEYGKMLL